MRRNCASRSKSGLLVDILSHSVTLSLCQSIFLFSEREHKMVKRPLEALTEDFFLKKLVESLRS